MRPEYLRIQRAIFTDHRDAWGDVEVRGARPFVLNMSTPVHEVMRAILELPVPERDEPAPVSGEFEAREFELRP